MSDLHIPFSLEQETEYRAIIDHALSQPENKEFQRQAGVLTNMVLFEMIRQVRETSSDFFEVNPDYIYECMEFSFLSCYVYDWLYDEECKDIRLEIEHREQKITGKVSNFIKKLELLTNVGKSVVLHQNGLDPDRDLTEEEILQSFEEEMKYHSERYGLDVNDFKELVGNQARRTQKKRRKKPQGFGKKK